MVKELTGSEESYTSEAIQGKQVQVACEDHISTSCDRACKNMVVVGISTRWLEGDVSRHQLLAALKAFKKGKIL